MPASVDDSFAKIRPMQLTPKKWLLAKGEMGKAIEGHEWEMTPLGRLENWPPHLRMGVNLILDGAAPMAIIWGREFRFLYNDAYRHILQDKHPAALGTPGAEIFPELWHAILPLFEKAFRGEAVLIDDYELNLTRNGKTDVAYFSFTYNPIRSEDGEVDGFLAVVIETTARVMHEREHAQVFDTVLSAITDFAYTFDREGRFVYVNKALLDLWGIKLEDAVGKNFYELKYPEELAAHLQRQIQKVIEEKKALRDETPYESPGGFKGYFEYIFSPVFAPDGSVVVVAGTTRDITERKKLELEALAASQAKDDFLATLSHELRTPLNPVLLLATDAADNLELPERVRADFKTIAENITLEARLIDDLLDITRITHDKLPLDMRPRDIHSLLLGVMESIQPELAEKKLALTKRLDASPSVVVGDEMRLRQIFWNLLRNSVKFTREGGRITVSTVIRPARPGTLVVEVNDTGIGMTSAELATVFAPFAQGEHTTGGPGHYGGLGLGLAISRKIAEIHSGSISARSEGRNQGSTFVVELPLAQPGFPSAPPETEDAAPTAAKRVMGSYRVLLVEDHESSRHALVRLLVNRKLEALEAASGAEAIEKAKTHSFDLVISDIGLPDMNGYDLMAILKAAHGCCGIALSGYGTDKDIARSKEAGFMTHLTKPVQSQALDEALKQFVDRRQMVASGGGASTARPSG